MGVSLRRLSRDDALITHTAPPLAPAWPRVHHDDRHQRGRGGGGRCSDSVHERRHVLHRAEHDLPPLLLRSRWSPLARSSCTQRSLSAVLSRQVVTVSSTV